MISPGQFPPPSDLELRDIARLYDSYPVKALSYGTVRDYCDSCDHLSFLTANGDLKDCQRPWVLKAILSKLPRKGRLLEIGAGEPLVADLLQRLGYEVWIVDPYDGSGNGPTAFEEYRRRYPALKFLRTLFGDDLKELEPRSVDCIYSISVLEHLCDAIDPVFGGLKRFLKPGGVTIHAVDHVTRGHSSEYHLANLRRMMDGFGFEQSELDRVLEAMRDDLDTYYLSAEGHNRWRGGLPYDDFPMRDCVSIQIVAESARLTGA